MCWLQVRNESLNGVLLRGVVEFWARRVREDLRKLEEEERREKVSGLGSGFLYVIAVLVELSS